MSGSRSWATDVTKVAEDMRGLKRWKGWKGRDETRQRQRQVFHAQKK